jgi:hypothetical protein
VLATASDDGTARLWETDADRDVCAPAFPAITPAGWRHYLPGSAYRPPC